MTRALPDIPKIKAHWDRRCDELPYLIVPMSNGTVVRYNPEIQQPAFRKAIENVKNMVVGYETKK